MSPVQEHLIGIKSLAMVKSLIASVYFLRSSLSVLPVAFESYALLKTAELELYLDSKEDSEFFISAEYFSEDENLHLHTQIEINSILIYNVKGELEFMLPVGSEKVILGKSMFLNTTYRLGFDFETEEELNYASIIIK